GDRVSLVIVDHRRTDEIGSNQADDREEEQHGPHHDGNATGTMAQGALGFNRYIQSSMNCQAEESYASGQDRVPVQNSGVGTELPVSPQGLEEVPLLGEGNSSNDIA